MLFALFKGYKKEIDPCFRRGILNTISLFCPDSLYPDGNCCGWELGAESILTGKWIRFRDEKL